jgi:hypothetical protein
MNGQSSTAADESLDRTGRVLVAIGAVILEAIAVAVAIGAVWFITHFSDSSEGCGLDCVIELWPLSVVAIAVVVVVMLAFAWVIRGGGVALAFGLVTGLLVALGGLAMLARGQHEDFRFVVLVAGISGGAALALGAATRLTARRSAG